MPSTPAETTEPASPVPDLTTAAIDLPVPSTPVDADRTCLTVAGVCGSVELSPRALDTGRRDGTCLASSDAHIGKSQSQASILPGVYRGEEELVKRISASRGGRPEIALGCVERGVVGARRSRDESS